MRVLVACEFSGRVRDAFIRRGHDAMSCDFRPCVKKNTLGGPHYTGDVRDIIGDGFDGMIAFPDCTYLCSSGLHHNTRNQFRRRKTEDALAFVRLLLNADIPKIALENPIGCISTRIKPASQVIHPWQFGHDASKATCLWLKGFPDLVPTMMIDPKYACPCGGPRFEFGLGKFGCPNCCGDGGPARAVWSNQTDTGQNRLGPSPKRAKIRSTTYQGIADAMADQWGGEIKETTRT